MIETLTINDCQVFKTGTSKTTGKPWTMYTLQTPNGEYKSFIEVKPGTTAQFETEVKTNNYRGQSTKEQWIKKFTGSIEQYSAPKKPVAAAGSEITQSGSSGFTESDRDMLRETFEMVKAVYDENHPA